MHQKVRVKTTGSTAKEPGWGSWVAGTAVLPGQCFRRALPAAWARRVGPQLEARVRGRRDVQRLGPSDILGRSVDNWGCRSRNANFGSHDLSMRFLCVGRWPHVATAHPQTKEPLGIAVAPT